MLYLKSPQFHAVANQLIHFDVHLLISPVDECTFVDTVESVHSSPELPPNTMQ